MPRGNVSPLADQQARGPALQAQALATVDVTKFALAAVVESGIADPAGPCAMIRA